MQMKAVCHFPTYPLACRERCHSRRHGQYLSWPSLGVTATLICHHFVRTESIPAIKRLTSSKPETLNTSNRLDVSEASSSYWRLSLMHLNRACQIVVNHKPCCGVEVSSSRRNVHVCTHVVLRRFCGRRCNAQFTYPTQVKASDSGKSPTAPEQASRARGKQNPPPTTDRNIAISAFCNVKIADIHRSHGTQLSAI